MRVVMFKRSVFSITFLVLFGNLALAGSSFVHAAEEAIIGYSAENRPIVAISKTTENCDLRIALITGIHPRERGVRKILAHLAERPLAPEHCYYFIPDANPDGNARFEAGETDLRKNARGVDLNRNFPSSDWTLNSDPNSPTYSGPSTASEPETQALMQYLSALKPDVLIDLHNYSNTQGGYFFAILPTSVKNYDDRVKRAQLVFGPHRQLARKPFIRKPSGGGELITWFLETFPESQGIIVEHGAFHPNEDELKVQFGLWDQWWTTLALPFQKSILWHPVSVKESKDGTEWIARTPSLFAHWSWNPSVGQFDVLSTWGEKEGPRYFCGDSLCNTPPEVPFKFHICSQRSSPESDCIEKKLVQVNKKFKHFELYLNGNKISTVYNWNPTLVRIGTLLGWIGIDDRGDWRFSSANLEIPLSQLLGRELMVGYHNATAQESGVWMPLPVRHMEAPGNAFVMTAVSSTGDTKSLFPPGTHRRVWVQQSVEAINSHDGFRIPYRIFQPEKGTIRGAALLVHGGPQGTFASLFSGLEDELRLLLDLGLVVAVPEIRGANINLRGHTEALAGKVAMTVEDVKAVAGDLRSRHGLGINKIIYFGHSFGAHVGFLASVSGKGPFDAYFLNGGSGDLLADATGYDGHSQPDSTMAFWVCGPPNQCPETWETIRAVNQISQLDRSVYLYHNEDDGNVSYWGSRVFFDAGIMAGKAPLINVRMHQTGGHDIADWDELRRDLITVLTN